jgi:AAA+ ATPase superfamily predicted ATPase
MKKLRNPFLLTGYYSMDYFCDREQELGKFHEHIDNERNVVLHSWRRIGKTALIKCFITQLEKEKKAEAVYIDLLGTRNMAEAIRSITQAVFDRFGRTGSGISYSIQKLLGSIGLELTFDSNTGAPSLGMGMRSAELHDKSFAALGEFLVNRNKRILVVFDEFQQVVRYTEQNGEALFRSWMQSFPGIRFIFCGSHRHMMISMFSGKNRPFYGSAQLMQLDPIEQGPYAEFIGRMFKSGGKEIDRTAIQQIFKWSRMQTYCIQLICNKLYALYDHVEEKSLEGVFHEILQQESSFFSDYLKLLTDMQWRVLKAVAREEPLRNPLSKDFIGKYDLGASSSVSTALGMLKKHELIFQEDGAYHIHEVLLRNWLESL